jgi:uncharacterized protein
MGKLLKLLFIFLIIINIQILVSCKSDISNNEKIGEESSSGVIKEEDFLNYTGNDFPKPAGYINDYANILDTDYINKLDILTKDLERKTTAEVLIVTIESSGDTSLETYATELFNSWGIGKKDKNNGVLFLVSKNDNKIIIKAGVGLDMVITNDVAKQIIDNFVVPEFKELNYSEGTYQGIKEIVKYILTIQ